MFMLRRKTVGCLAVGVMTIAPLVRAQEAGPQRWRIMFDSRRDGKPEIYVMDVDGSNPRRLTQTPGARKGSVQPVWSPDRKQIAFASNRDGNFEIYVMDADGSNVRRLTHTQGEGRGCWRPAWSPDGTTIAFQSNRDGKSGKDNKSEYEIYVIEVDGSGLRRLTTNETADLHPAWSPDGKSFVFSSNRSGHWEIYVMNAEGAHVRRLTHDGRTAARADWSPDGNKIAFMSTRDAKDENDRNGAEIYVMDADGSNVRRLTDNQHRDARPHWSPDGKQIVFQSGTAPTWNDWEIYVMDANGSNVRRLTFNKYADMHPDW